MRKNGTGNQGLYATMTTSNKRPARRVLGLTAHLPAGVWWCGPDGQRCGRTDIPVYDNAGAMVLQGGKTTTGGYEVPFEGNIVEYKSSVQLWWWTGTLIPRVKLCIQIQTTIRSGFHNPAPEDDRCL